MAKMPFHRSSPVQSVPVFTDSPRGSAQFDMILVSYEGYPCMS